MNHGCAEERREERLSAHADVADDLIDFHCVE